MTLTFMPRMTDLQSFLNIWDIMSFTGQSDKSLKHTDSALTRR